ncbi:hypothetical protein [Streptomyces buecherae]|uniref:tetratricopeptide repeat protein n=1 Tax=Streptomyces buecherae TaxID=2763006 RepID=UPI00369D49AA
MGTEMRSTGLNWRLGIHPTPYFTEAVLRTLLRGMSSTERTTAIEHARRRLTTIGSGRYALGREAHQWLRGQARGRDAAACVETVAHLGDYYLATAGAATNALFPVHRVAEPTFTLSTPESESTVRDAESAARWLERERSALSAVQELARAAGLHHLAGQLADAAWAAGLLGRTDAWYHSQRSGWDSAERSGDRPLQARLLTARARLLCEAGDQQQALVTLDQATRLYDRRNFDHVWGMAVISDIRAAAHQALGHGVLAREALLHAIRLRQAIGDTIMWELAAWAEVESLAGYHGTALDLLAEAHREAGRVPALVSGTPRPYEAMILRLIGVVHHRAGQHDEARDALTRALGRTVGAGGEIVLYQEAARNHRALADVARAVGSSEAARRHESRARVLWRPTTL